MNNRIAGLRPAILVVDDKEENLIAFRTILKQLDADIVTASNGMDALANMVKREFAFLLLDVRMPEMDGLEVARILKQDRESKRVPILFVTADAYLDTAAIAGYEAGGFDYIVKPVDPRILLGKARNLLELYTYQQESIGKTALRYNTLFNGMPGPVLICEKTVSEASSLRLRFIEANPAFESFAGISAKASRGQMLLSLIPDFDLSLEARCIAVSEGASPLQMDRVRLFGDSYFHVSAHSPAEGFVAIILTDISGMVEAERRIESLLEDKVLLLQEVHHRVKNNLQMIVSLLELQSGSVDDPRLEEQLRSVQNRVYAIASVHDQLGLSHSSQSVNLADHVSALVAINKASSAPYPREAVFKLSVDPSVALSLDVAVPITLTLQELISNCLKHCRTASGSVLIDISARLVTQGCCSLCVKDNGSPESCEDDFLGKNTSGIGWILIEGLVDQVKGTVRIDKSEGCAVTVTFPVTGAGRPLGPHGAKSIR